jgi:murein DD-endopeptidase MepM/ murein hydrolase activator NlpD
LGALVGSSFVGHADADGNRATVRRPAPPATLPAEAEDAETLETAEPTEWMPSRGRDCRRRRGTGRARGRMVCDGPRRVPVPHGPAADLAEELGLGTDLTARHLRGQAPTPEWVAAVEGQRPGPTGLAWPVEGGSLWRGFGLVRRQAGLRHRPHHGIDIGAPEGTLFRSVADGVVAYANNGVSGYGNLAIVIHADGSVAHYAHSKAIYLFAGQQVRQGQVLGEVGHTGLSRGSHVHFELHVNGRPRNPILRMQLPEGLTGPGAATARSQTRRHDATQRRRQRATRSRPGT